MVFDDFHILMLLNSCSKHLPKILWFLIKKTSKIDQKSINKSCKKIIRVSDQFLINFGPVWWPFWYRFSVILPQVDPKLAPSWSKLAPSWLQLDPRLGHGTNLGAILAPRHPPGTPRDPQGPSQGPPRTIFHQFLIRVGLNFDQNLIIFEVHCSPKFDVDVTSNFNTDFMLSFIFLFNAATSLQVSQPPSLQSPIASAGIAKRKQ